ncbi:MAG: DUF2235 domain-containing protein [Pseudomonadota bacterium]
MRGAGQDSRVAGGDTTAARTLVFICDGTLSTTAEGARSNAGRLARLLAEVGPRRGQAALYHPGIQGTGVARWLNAATGRTIDHGIMAGYAFLASRYRPGDRICLFGYSRGAYAVRSLAGMIGKIGLLSAEHATERNVVQALRLYRACSPADGRRRAPKMRDAFARRFCRQGVEIEVLGVWDTVRALGLPVPFVDRLMPDDHTFHDDALGPHIRHGYHALALHETRAVYTPVLWRKSPHWQGRLEQCWFPGNHGDVGGEVRCQPDARGLSNISLNWMLRRAARHGITLPTDWESRFAEDASAPSTAGASALEWLTMPRTRRQTGAGDGEIIHLSVRTRAAGLTLPPPQALPPGFSSGRA